MKLIYLREVIILSGKLDRLDNFKMYLANEAIKVFPANLLAPDGKVIIGFDIP
jgi:hypothetical protein